MKDKLGINGMWTLLQQLMIGSCMSLPLSLGCCILIEWNEEVKTSCNGFPPKNGCLRLDPSIVPWFVVKTIAFLWRVFGGLRLLWGWPLAVVWSPPIWPKGAAQPPPDSFFFFGLKTKFIFVFFLTVCDTCHNWLVNWC